MSIPEFLSDIYIENKTIGKTIGIAQKGEPPYAIIMPMDFDYPLEKQPITGAYTKFIEWAQDVNTSRDWYQYENAQKIFPSLFKK